MTRWEFAPSPVLREISELPEDLRDQVFEDLEELEIDPINERNDRTSTIQPYKDPDYSSTYSIMVADGRFWIVYQVMADYPRIRLLRLIDAEELFDRLSP